MLSQAATSLEDKGCRHSGQRTQQRIAFALSPMSARRHSGQRLCPQARGRSADEGLRQIAQSVAAFRSWKVCSIVVVVVVVDMGFFSVPLPLF